MTGGESFWVVVPGEPVPAPRPRFRIVPTRPGPEIIRAAQSGVRAVMGCFRPAPYTPSDHPYAAWRERARAHFVAARDDVLAGAMFSGVALCVRLLCVRELPTSHRRVRTPPPRSWSTARGAGDVDNLAKGPLDAANGVLWTDDCTVAQLTVETVVGAQGEEPRLEMLVSVLPADGAALTSFERLRGSVGTSPPPPARESREDREWDQGTLPY